MVQIAMAPRPRAAEQPGDRRIAEAERYGPNYYRCKPWGQRSIGMQTSIEGALVAFQRWRRDAGENLVSECDPWEYPPPTPETVRVYVHKLHTHCGKWRQLGFAALRTYFYHQERPDLFRLVEGCHHG